MISLLTLDFLEKIFENYFKDSGSASLSDSNY
jgi:hypothetical protein